MNDLIKVMIIDDHHVVRDSFRKVFSKANGFQVVKELTTAFLAVDECIAIKPDLLLMDVCTEGGYSGLDALKRIKDIFPDMKVIIMSGFDEISYAPRAKALGADAFVFKSKSIDFFLDTAKKVINGETYFPEPKKIPVPQGEVPLSEREMEILRLLCGHKSRAEVAEELFISDKTVKRHVENMLEKTGFSSTVELIVYVISNGWVNPNY